MGCQSGNTIRESKDLSVDICRVLSDKLNIKMLNTGSPTRCCIKLYIQRFDEFDYVHPDTQVARVCTSIINIMLKRTHNSNYFNMFNKRIRSSISKICDFYMKPYYSGVYVQSIDSVVFDSLQDVCNIIKSEILNINKDLESCKLVNVSIVNENDILPSDSNMYVCKISKELTPDLIQRYEDWYNKDKVSVGILEPDNRASIKLILKDGMVQKKDIDIMITDAGKVWVIVISSKLGINPYLIMKKLYPKITIYNLYNNMSVLLYSTFNQGNNSCRCGNKEIYDKIRNKSMGLCHKCLSKALLKSVVNNL